jgi:two-component system LytT family response regulator
MKAIIIDDESKGREVLRKLIGHYCPNIEVCADAANIHDGFMRIVEHRPDIVFLDVQMPGGNGFDLLEKFDKIFFEIIFTTAHDHYALKAIKFHALDYLLKPIDIDELIQGVERVRQAIQEKTTANRYEGLVYTNGSLKITGKISLPMKDSIVYINISDIIRIESDGGYSTFYTVENKNYTTSKNLKDYEDILPNEFFRIHKSHMINMKKVKKYIRVDGYYVEMEDGSIVEIARRKKDDFLRLMSESI